MTLPNFYLSKFKQQIKYYYDDQDDILMLHLQSAAENILSQYMEIPSAFWENEKIQEIIMENKKFQLAVNTLASTTYQNPDVNLVNAIGSVVDKENIYRILGDLTNYYSFDNKRILKSHLARFENGDGENET